MEDYKIVEKYAIELGVDSFLDVSFNTLSGGSKQNVAICRALVQETPIIIMDEPMSALDIGKQADFLSLVLKLMEDMPSDFKLCMSAVLVQLFTSREFEECDEGDDFLTAVDELGVFDYDSFFMMFALFYEQMKKEKLYEIDLDFIENVGAVFLRIKTDILTKNM